MIPDPPEIRRRWNLDNETVNGYGDRVWRVRDLRALVASEPSFDLPLALIPLDRHDFKCADLVEFAQHVIHCRDADLDDPIIMDDRGSILDGRHRIVKALILGRKSLPCKRVPNGANPSTYDK